jgi:neuralized-like protein 4
LTEGDRVGVMRTTQGVLHVIINGVDQGVAATNIPAHVYAVVDIFGTCAQVSIVEAPAPASVPYNRENGESTG